MKLLVITLGLVAVVQCNPMIQDESVMRSLAGNLVDCHNSDLFTCIKEKALIVTERLRTVRKLDIFEGLTIVNNDPREARSLEPLPVEPLARSKAVAQRLWDSTSDFLQSTELELSYGGSDDDEESSSRSNDVEARGKKKQMKKKLKMILPLLILGKIKAVAIIVLALVVMAASLFKLAMIAKLAFIVKIIAIIKALLAKKHAHEETYEVAHGWEPHVEHSHVEHPHGWEGGWSRSGNEANSLAYSAYNQ